MLQDIFNWYVSARMMMFVVNSNIGGRKMGEVADDMLNGIICQSCGVWMRDCFSEDGMDLNADIFDHPPGHPRTCKGCLEEEEDENC